MMKKGSESPKSVVQLYGQQISSCGYCKASPDHPTSVSYGIVSSSMLIEDYESLMLVGWRRSGTYFYKPAMTITCCPQYPIRLEASKFVPSKSQKLVLKRLNRYLSTGQIRVDPGSESIEHPKECLNESEAKEEHQPSGDSSLTIETVDPKFTEERFALYKKYQTAVHNDKLEDLSEAGFTRFLVTSPLVRNDSSSTASASSSSLVAPKLLGTFHQLYRLNGKLIAVGVVDFLPTGVSSVYMFYDPDMRDLVLGKYTALKEIEYCQKQGYQYYYMGFYIHSCVKMRYKGEYKPSELLCPTSLKWYPLTDAIKYLDKYKFCPLEPTLAEIRMLISDDERSEANEESGDAVSAATADIPGSDKATKFSQFTPRFFALKDFNSELRLTNELMQRIPLDIGGGSLVTIGMLTGKGKAIVEPILTEWIANCGLRASQFVVKLC